MDRAPRSRSSRLVGWSNDAPRDRQAGGTMSILAQPTPPDSFVGIAHPVRRLLLDALAGGDQPVSVLARPFAQTMSRPAISQHLRVLLDAGLVSARRVGRQRVYHLRPEGLREVREWLRAYDGFWRERLSALGAYLDETEGAGEA